MTPDAWAGLVLVGILAAYLLVLLIDMRETTHRRKHRRHPNRLLVLFRTEARAKLLCSRLETGEVQFLEIFEGHMAKQLLANATKGFVLSLAEIDAASGKVFSLKGPFGVEVADPGGAIAVVAGSDDQTTPTIFRPNGSGNVGTVTVTVTDESNNLVGENSFDVVAPPPPPPPPDKPDTLEVDFAPEP